MDRIPIVPLFANFEQQDCPICLEEIEDKNTTCLSCKHKIHAQCYNQFKNSSINNTICPICRQNITSTIQEV